MAMRKRGGGGSGKSLASQAMRHFTKALREMRQGKCGAAKKSVSAGYRVTNRIASAGVARRTTAAEKKALRVYPKVSAKVHRRCAR